MQHAALQGQVQQKRSPVIVGIGAAAVASAITLTMMLGNPSPAAVPDQTVSSSSMKQCQMIQRRLLVSTTKGSGTVRFRASGYLSPPFMLTTQPQVVIFPLMRPDTTPVEEIMSVEGSANDVVITSEVTDLHKVFDVAGAYTYTVTWAPRKSC
jgi:hypothetical protein